MQRNPKHTLLWNSWNLGPECAERGPINTGQCQGLYRIILDSHIRVRVVKTLNWESAWRLIILSSAHLLKNMLDSVKNIRGCAPSLVLALFLFLSFLLNNGCSEASVYHMKGKRYSCVSLWCCYLNYMCVCVCACQPCPGFSPMECKSALVLWLMAIKPTPTGWLQTMSSIPRPCI